MNTRVQKVSKSHKTQGFDQDTHECFMNVSDPAVWMDNSNDLVSILKRSPDEKERPSSVQLRFAEGGGYSYLSVWSADGKRFFGGLEGEELVLFLTRALARLNHRIQENARSMSSPLAAEDLAA
jgi:hypothetical protein